MKKLYYHLKGLLFGYPQRSTILDGIPRKAIAVVYPRAIINGTLREETAKVWNVTVKTTEPDVIFSSHAEWMLHIQMKRAAAVVAIGELEYLEIEKQVNSYAKGVKLKPIFLKNINS